MDTLHRKDNSLEKNRLCRQACGVSKPRFIYASYMKAITLRSQDAAEAPEVASWQQKCLGHTSRDSVLVNQHRGQEAALLVSKRPGGTDAAAYPLSEACLQQYNIITFAVCPGHPPCQSVLILPNVPAALQITLLWELAPWRRQNAYLCFQRINSRDIMLSTLEVNQDN